jgi:16S rRNA A1518/A1519 N6-dimethyltransferase RsmA/KsgA/DIM1 with predicted DNA glycosylase/AP lyase activity
MAFNYLLERDIFDTDNNLLTIIQYIKDKYNIDLFNKRTLEIGIGTGIKTIKFAQNFKSYYAIEPDKTLYDKLKILCKNNSCNIKAFNCDINHFITTITTTKKFSFVYLENVIQFLDFEQFMEQIRNILKSKSFILIKNKKALPYGWGSNVFNKSSTEFDIIAWKKYKEKLNNIYNLILSHKNLIYSLDDDYSHYFLIKTKKI